MSEFSLTSVLHFLTSKFINDMANIDKKSGFISIFANHFNGQCSMVNVSFCHTHETFLHKHLARIFKTTLKSPKIYRNKPLMYKYPEILYSNETF